MVDRRGRLRGADRVVRSQHPKSGERARHHLPQTNFYVNNLAAPPP
jgi:hypothetical protein